MFPEAWDGYFNGFHCGTKPGCYKSHCETNKVFESSASLQDNLTIENFVNGSSAVARFSGHTRNIVQPLR